jgi:hypothetical protein
MAVEPLSAGDPGEVAGYRLRGRLGAGGMGVVYLAFTPGGRPVALKVVRPELGDDPDFRVRFRQEIAAARRVHGMFTAQVLDADPEGSPPWLVTAYVAGPSLARAVADHGPMPEQSVLLLLAGVAEALSMIHGAGVVHRDLKPSNVLLAGDGPRVIDFGIARAVEATAVTRTGVRVGSPQFMAPEQVRGGVVGAAADVFALGALGVFAATGRPPFGEGDTAAVLYRVLHEDPDLAGCPEPVRAVIGGCLAKDPAARPAPAQVIEACQGRATVKTVEFTESWLPPAIAADLTRHAPPGPAQTAVPTLPWPGGPPRPGRGLTRTTVIAGVAAAALVAALAGYGLAALAGGGDSSKHPSAGGSSRHARGSHAVTGLKASAGPSPSPSSTLDPCLFGTWIGTADDVPATINSQPVMYTSHGGPTQIFRPDGINVLEFGPAATETVQVNGNTWTEVYHGRATARYETVNGELLVSDVSAQGTQTLLENGSYSNGGPLTLNTQPDRYTCSGNTLQLFVPDGGSEVLTRSTPPPRSGS